MAYVFLLIVTSGKLAWYCRGSGKAICKYQPGHLFQTVLAGHRTRPFDYQLHTVIIGRIMTCRHDYATVDTGAFHAEGGMIDLLGTAEPKIKDVDPHFPESRRQSLDECRTAQADIPPTATCFKA